VPEEPPRGLRFKLAESREELEAAFRLLHDVSVEAGVIQPSPSGVHLLLQHALPSTSVLIALQGGAVVGTVSLIRDNPLGLPMEADFDVSALRKWGSRIAEVSALAIAPAFRRSGGGGEALLLPLLAYLYRYATYYFGIGYFTATVLSSQARLHQAVFGFEVLGSTGRDKEGRGRPGAGTYLF
jgi:hypothetical protein